VKWQFGGGRGGGGRRRKGGCGGGGGGGARAGGDTLSADLIVDVVLLQSRILFVRRFDDLQARAHTRKSPRAPEKPQSEHDGIACQRHCSFTFSSCSASVSPSNDTSCIPRVASTFAEVGLRGVPIFSLRVAPMFVPCTILVSRSLSQLRVSSTVPRVASASAGGLPGLPILAPCTVIDVDAPLAIAIICALTCIKAVCHD